MVSAAVIVLLPVQQEISVDDTSRQASVWLINLLSSFILISDNLF